MVSEPLHHIRLVAGFEIQPNVESPKRTLDRAHSEAMAVALADDLARVEDQAREGTLSIAGGLFEPNELLRPGFKAWQALEELAVRAIGEQGNGGQILAIGAHAGRLPDARLSPDQSAPAGQFLVLPLLLSGHAALISSVETSLENQLFERGGINPPARARLAESCAVDTVHGQLLTLTDLIALQHVQMDTAGLGAFWPVVEHVLLDPDQSRQFDLPAGLEVCWQVDSGSVRVQFQSFDARARTPDEHALWVRAFRTLSALLQAHDIDQQTGTELTHDSQRDCLIETIGASKRPNSLTEQVHPDCGLIGWTLVEDGQQLNLYPLSSRGFEALKSDFRQRALPVSSNPEGICYDSATGTLIPAP
jgi:hypothetical protein